MIKNLREGILAKLKVQEFDSEPESDFEAKTVFLGGTCNDSTWRATLIEKLKVDYFNPVVDDWNEEAQQQEIEHRENDKFVLYVITPLMTGVYSIAEVVDDSNKRPEKTLFCVLETDAKKSFNKHQLKSLNMVKSMVLKNGAKVFDNLDDVATFLNATKKRLIKLL